MLTDVGFYELRHSGTLARFLRGFRAVYLGAFFNVMSMAAVTLAAIEIGGVMLGLTPLQTVVVAAAVTVFYSMLGGLTGVLVTDFFQFVVAMAGSVAAVLRRAADFIACPASARGGWETASARDRRRCSRASRPGSGR